MFDGLKKYKVVKSFNGYPAGITVAFNGADAQKYADFIVSKEKVATPVVTAPVAPVVEEVEEDKPKRKYVRKGRK
jgi:hypothetical protein